MMPSNCNNCGVSFSVEVEEQNWLSTHSKDLPSVCPRCRAFSDGLQDESVTCANCGRVFIYPRELKLFARLFEWPRPRRCIGGCKVPGPPLTEQEERISDFFRRIRSGRRQGGGRRVVMSMNVASPSGRGGARRNSSSPPAGLESNPLAQALKEFQERKKRRT